MANPDAKTAPRREYESSSPEETERLGEWLGAALPAGSVLALEGDLGAGKTCLVRGLARGLGIAESIASPTYVLMQATEGGRLPLYHFDAWMDGRETDFFEDGGDQWLVAGGVAAVEWAERVTDFLPAVRLALSLAHHGPERRRIVVERVGEGELAAALDAVLEGLPELLGPPPKPQYEPLRSCGFGLKRRREPAEGASEADLSGSD